MRDKTLTWAEKLVLRESDLVCFNQKNGFIFRFNDTGYLAFLCFENPASIEAVSRYISDAFGVCAEIVETDLTPLIADLLSKGFLIPGVRNE